MKKIIFALMMTLSAAAFAGSLPARNILLCDDAAHMAATAGYFKAKGKSLDDTVKDFLQATDKDTPANVIEDVMRIIKWAFDQDEAGNAALGKKYHDLCVGKEPAARPEVPTDKQQGTEAK